MKILIIEFSDDESSEYIEGVKEEIRKKYMLEIESVNKIITTKY